MFRPTPMLIGSIVADLAWRACHQGNSSGIGLLVCASIAVVCLIAQART